MAVTFEFEDRAPVTWRGTLQATQPHVAMSRATRQAHIALRPRIWISASANILSREREEGDVSDE